MGFFDERHVSEEVMKNQLLEIGEAITAIVIIIIVILSGIAGIALSMKLIGSLLGAH